MIDDTKTKLIDPTQVKVNSEFIDHQPEPWETDDDNLFYLIGEITVTPRRGVFSDLENIARDVGVAIARSLYKDDTSDPSSEPTRIADGSYRIGTTLVAQHNYYPLQVTIAPDEVSILSRDGPRVDLLKLSEDELRTLRGTLINECSSYVK